MKYWPLRSTFGKALTPDDINKKAAIAAATSRHAQKNPATHDFAWIVIPVFASSSLICLFGCELTGLAFAPILSPPPLIQAVNFDVDQAAYIGLPYNGTVAAIP